MSNVQKQSWLIDRRHALRAMGTCIALPMLECMTPLRAAEKISTPRRSAFIYLANGVHSLNYQITKHGKDYEFSQSLKPLEKHREVITPFSGLHHPGSLGHHHNCINVFLTGGKIGAAHRNTISVDQEMAEITGQHTRYPSMEIALTQGSLAWTADGVQLPAMRKCSQIFASLFEEPKGGVAKQRRGLHRRGSILDAVLGEAKALDNQLSREDRGRLEQYLTSVREVEVRTDRADKWLDVPRPKVEAGVKSRLNRNVSLQQMGDFLRTMYDVIVLAFQTDMTRVATFCNGIEGQGPAIPEIGVNQDRHSLSHHNGNPKLMADLTKSDIFNIEQFGYFINRLAETKDADGSLLDTTMALWGSGMAFGHSHGNANLPLVVAGGSKLGLKHGSHLDFNKQVDFEGYQLDQPGKHYAICTRPVNEKVRMSNLLLTMAQKMGVETNKFGDGNGSLGDLEA
mgnify:CR=1 FL=1